MIRGRISVILLMTALVTVPWTPTTSAAPDKGHIGPSAPPSTSIEYPQQSRGSGSLRTSPIRFVPNVGQFDPRARFVIRGNHSTIWVTDDTVWITVVSDVGPSTAAIRRPAPGGGIPQNDIRTAVNLKLTFPGLRPEARLMGVELQSGKLNYFQGLESNWHTNVSSYGAVRWQNAYASGNLTLGQADGDLSLALQATGDTPERELEANVRLQVEGADRLTVDANGELVAETAVGLVALPQLRGGDGALRQAVIHGNVVAFGPKQAPQPGAPNGQQPGNAPLNDSTKLLYGTYLGGTKPDATLGMAVKSDGSKVYMTGQTTCGGGSFPNTPGVISTSCSGATDAFVIELSPDGNNGYDLIYGSFLGGTGDDVGYAIAVDSNGYAYILGGTTSCGDNPLPVGCTSSFPTTSNAYDRKCGTDGLCDKSGSVVYGDVFVTKVNANGTSLLYSTYLGDSKSEGYFPTGTNTNNNRDGNPLVLGSSGVVYITGATLSPNFPTKGTPYQSTNHSGSNYGDAFVSEIDTSQSSSNSLVASTFLGGSNDEYGMGIALGSGTNTSVYLIGFTYSGSDATYPFPTTAHAYDTSCGTSNNCNGKYDVFVSKLSSGLSSLQYSTFLGGSDGEIGSDIKVDSSGYIYFTGWTYSSDFPTQATVGNLTPYQSTCGDDQACDGTGDLFLGKLDPAGNDTSDLVYSTYVGGDNFDDGNALVIDSSGVMTFVGWTWSTDYPTTTDAYDTSFNGTCKTDSNGNDVGGDAFLTRLDPAGNGNGDLKYSTYLGEDGGTCDDAAYAVWVAANPGGDGDVAYIAGRTESDDFPTTFGAFDRTFGDSGTNCGPSGHMYPCDDGFFVKLQLPQ